MKRITTVLAAAALAVAPAAVAQAKKPDAPGKGHGQEHAEKGKGHDRGPNGERPRKPKKPKTVAYVAKGTVAAVDAEAGTISVAVADRKGATNRHARAWRGETITFAVKESRLKVKDVNGDGERDLADVAVGDLAKVLAKLPRKLDDMEQPFAVKRIVVKHPEPEQDDDGQSGDDGAGGEQEQPGS